MIAPKRDERGLLYIGEGGSSFTRDVYLVNPTDRDWTRHRYVLTFGAYGWTRLMVWANDLDSALEEAAEWLAEYAPGHIKTHWGDEHKDLIREVCEERGIPWPEGFEALDDEEKWEICEAAEVDLTRTESGFITSEWGIALEAPTREELIEYVGESSDQ